MNVDKLLREVVRQEIERALGPLAQAVARLQAQNVVVERLTAAFGSGTKRAGAAFKPLRGRPGPKPSVSTRPCAIAGCPKPARAKGYCSAHYQKFRMLDRSGRLPSAWKANASPGSVPDVVLPRGRAGAKALAQAKKK